MHSGNSFDFLIFRLDLPQMKELLVFGLICLIGFNFSCSRNETNRSWSSDSTQEPINNAMIFDNDSAQQALLTIYLNEKSGQFEFKPTKDSVEKIEFISVAPLFRRYCTSCHRIGGNAPFSLASDSDIRKRAKAIREALVTTIMPPWRASNIYNQYHNSQAMPDSSREKIIHWINQGAEIDKSLSTVDLVQPLVDKADIVLKTTTPFTLSSNKDDYVCNIIDPQFKEDTYVTAFDFYSDNINIIHHYTLFVDTTGNYLGEDGNWSCKRDSIFNNLDLVDTWTKGIRAVRYTKGLAYRFPKASKFLIQTHYAGYGNKGKSEACTMKIFTAKERPQHIVKWSVTNKNDLFIPANTVQADGSFWKVEEDIMLLGVVPHMHYLGQKMEVFAIKPVGEKEKILFIDDWSYVVQNKYMLRQPILLPSGSKIYTNVVYDNTEENPEQPNHPVRDVTFDLSSYDEMLAIGHYYISAPKALEIPKKTVEFIK